MLTAQTKDMKMFDGSLIEIQVGAGSTLYITNFPAIADEAYIRDLFGKVSLESETPRKFANMLLVRRYHQHPVPFTQVQQASALLLRPIQVL